MKGRLAKVTGPDLSRTNPYRFLRTESRTPGASSDKSPYEKLHGYRLRSRIYLLTPPALDRPTLDDALQVDSQMELSSTVFVRHYGREERRLIMRVLKETKGSRLLVATREIRYMARHANQIRRRQNSGQQLLDDHWRANVEKHCVTELPAELEIRRSSRPRR